MEKKEIKEKEEIQKKKGFDFPLLDLSEEDQVKK